MRLFAASLSLFFALVAPLIASDNREALFLAGNEAYQEGNYAAAISAYRAAASHGASAPLHFNLANAWFRLGEVGPAILHYEKAHALDPGNPDITRNLRFVREQAGLATPTPPWTTSYAELLGASVWLAAGIVAFWILVAALVLPPWWGGYTWRSWTLVVLSALVLAGSTLGIWGWSQQQQGVVVLPTAATLTVAPTERSPQTAEVRGGQVGRVRSTHEGYVLVRFDDETNGWIPRAQLGFIWSDDNPGPEILNTDNR